MIILAQKELNIKGRGQRDTSAHPRLSSRQTLQVEWPLAETDNQVDVDISKLSNQDISELIQQEALGEGWNKAEQAQHDHDHDDKGEVEEEAALELEDDLTEELVDENKVEDSHILRSAYYSIYLACYYWQLI